MTIIHTVGDSHCYAGWENVQLDNVKIYVHHLGAITCSSFGIKKFELYNIKDANVQENEVVCFILGEIDCRTHLSKHKENYKEIIDKIVENYFNTIKLNVDQYKNLTVMVQSIVPPAKKKSYLTDAIIEIEKQYGTPTLGEDNERKVYVQYMNKKIKENCVKYNYIFFNLYDEYSDNDGFLNSSLSDGNVHIKDTKFLEEKLKKMFKENKKTIAEIKYKEACNIIGSDICEHLKILRLYSEECSHITEMGVQWIVSTWAFLSAKPKKLISIDIRDPIYYGAKIQDVYDAAKEIGVDFEFILGNDLEIPIEETDLLFLDTEHTYVQLSKELKLLSPKTKKYIIMHDTETFGDELIPAINEFLLSNSLWKIEAQFYNNNGLIILKHI